MKKLTAFLLILLLPISSMATHLCQSEKTTLAIADCLIEKTQQADIVLNKYFKAAKKRYGDNPKMVRLLNISQKQWRKYQEAHCNTVYQEWSEGTMRLVSHPYCLLYTTKQRTYDIWREFLTYQDSTEPILPEPELVPYKK